MKSAVVEWQRARGICCEGSGQAKQARVPWLWQRDGQAGRAADFVLLDQAQHAPGKTMLESIQLGNLPGVAMTVIDGVVRSERSRNTPPAMRAPEIIGRQA